ncbi:MAG: TonB family protein [candidate division Zixibacteria bacterium]|nr:TonB family protein [candidate division Zixibacteria bacterium]
MKKEIFFSALGHFVAIAVILLFSSTLSRSKPYPSIYQVNLVNLPKATPKLVEQKKPEEATKQVTLKQEKVVPKKSAPVSKKVQKEDPKKEEAELAPKKESSTQKIEGLGEAQFEGEKLDAPYYISIVFGRIKSMWANPVESTTLQATVRFTIQKNGEVVQTEIEQSSGNALYDQAALRAVMASGPLPPLPSHYAGNELTVHLNFVGVP